MLSIARLMAKQSLRAEANRAEAALLQNSAAQRSLLYSPHFGGGIATVSAAETSLGLSNLANETQLMAINAELAALNNSGSHLDYMT